MFRITGDIQVIEVNLLWIAIILLLGIIIFLFHNFSGLKLLSGHDNSLAKQFLDKFPLVSENFINKPSKEQIIENNQEIHELNLQIADLKKQIAELKGNKNAG